jgi:D-threo-aldose 1-dehydrogenase
MRKAQKKSRNLRECGVAGEDVIISNKLGWRRAPLIENEPIMDPGIYFGLEHDAVHCISYDGILECWEEGNRLLGAPYRAELLALNDPDEYLSNATSSSERLQRLAEIRGAYRALCELQERGEATAIGVAAMDWRTIQEIDSLVELDWVMIDNSLTVFDYPPELLEFLESLRRRGIAIINSAVFHLGFLVGGDYLHYRPVSPENSEHQQAVAWRDRFLRYRFSPAAACIQFALSPAGVCCIAWNSSHPERIAQDVLAFEVDIPQAFWDAA